jgi:hypothetical protein
MPDSLSLVAVFATVSLFFDLLIASPALPWFDKGHRVVGLIALMNLATDTRMELEKILPEGRTLADAAVWPDHEGRSIRDFDPLHYVSIPENAAGYDRARDCPTNNCMVEALPWFASVVADRRAPIALRRLALYYVAHLVGDMHQPLHAGRVADRGGVDTAVSYRGTSTNLHFFWDSNLVDLETGSEDEIAERLARDITPDQRLQWQSGEPAEWTNESLALFRSHAYDTGPSAELSDDYVARARPVVRTRLAQAGIRLAWLLNRTLKP